MEEPERITFQKIGRSILSVLNLERGIFYTILVLLTKPGEAIETYLKRDRKKLVEPVRFSLVVLAVTTLVFLKFEGGDVLNGLHTGVLEAGMERGVKKKPVEVEKMNLFIDFIKDYCNVFLIFIIPIMASFSRDMFNDSAYNGAEHLVINAYIFSFQSLIFIFIPLTSKLFFLIMDFL